MKIALEKGQKMYRVAPFLLIFTFQVFIQTIKMERHPKNVKKVFKGMKIALVKSKQHKYGSNSSIKFNKSNPYTHDK